MNFNGKLIDRSDTRIPFSYYDEDIIAKTLQNNKENSKTDEKIDKNLKEKIEDQIKKKYNLIIPAILIEVQEKGRNSVELMKDDLRDVFYINFSFLQV